MSRCVTDVSCDFELDFCGFAGAQYWLRTKNAGYNIPDHNGGECCTVTFWIDVFAIGHVFLCNWQEITKLSLSFCLASFSFRVEKKGGKLFPQRKTCLFLAVEYYRNKHDAGGILRRKFLSRSVSVSPATKDTIYCGTAAYVLLGTH